MMTTQELFQCCKAGNLNRVQYLVEHKEVELNLRDNWDSTPLYYACLCGHEELVRYLLENGAKCEANTFDGERCLYGALNNDIRSLLRSYKAITPSTIRRDLYIEFLRKLLERGHYADITFLVHGESIPAHRCILAARSQYFRELLTSKWQERSTVSLTHKLISAAIFKSVLCFLYTGKVEFHIDKAEEIMLLARHCKLANLVEQLEHKMTHLTCFASTKPGVRVTTLSVEPVEGCRDLNTDLCQLADQALPAGFCDQDRIELPFLPETGEVCLHTDIIFSVEKHHFQCHKAFFCGRSDYFKALVEDHFGENSVEEDLPVVNLQGISAPVFLQVLYYVYQDDCELTEQNVYDVLWAGDLYLLPGLKRLCANTIGQYLDVDSVISILRSARLFNISRLEDQCAEFISMNIEKLVKSEEFTAIVREDAETVRSREETDTICIIDDVRYHITSFMQTFSDMYEAEQKLALIDSFLEELGLDA